VKTTKKGVTRSLAQSAPEPSIAGDWESIQKNHHLMFSLFLILFLKYPLLT